MCLAVPGKILSLQQSGRATVDMLGAQRDISLRLTPGACVNDYVLVHAGFAIQVIDAQEAAETLQLVHDLADLADAR
ncbi:MAG: HypC/HybG/HupF family hydrogenase formation chaperone [Coriobacteriaceae bacterium]|nr:HypC/HybG/HupF family hydrogenase formation chaperone [Coriobacteriaceae bacterium]